MVQAGADPDGVRGVLVEPSFDSKFHFHGKFWMVKFGYGIYPEYSHI